MGVTQQTLRIVQFALEVNPRIESVCDLGAQIEVSDRTSQSRPDGTIREKYPTPSGYPYMSEYWKERGKKYLSIDMNGENGSMKWDLGDDLPTRMQFDLVMDCGTCEHIMSLHRVLRNVHMLTKPGGMMIHVNPKTGSWPQHGFHFFTDQFWKELAAKMQYEILYLQEAAAMGNTTDGWEIVTLLRKRGYESEFITKEEMPKDYPA